MALIDKRRCHFIIRLLFELATVSRSRLTTIFKIFYVYLVNSQKLSKIYECHLNIMFSLPSMEPFIEFTIRANVIGNANNVLALKVFKLRVFFNGN